MEKHSLPGHSTNSPSFASGLWMGVLHTVGLLITEYRIAQFLQTANEWLQYLPRGRYLSTILWRGRKNITSSWRRKWLVLASAKIRDICWSTWLTTSFNWLTSRLPISFEDFSARNKRSLWFGVHLAAPTRILLSVAVRVHTQHHSRGSFLSILIFCLDSKVYIWHKENGTLIETLSGHTRGCVNAVAWNSADPSMFASAGDDKIVRM